ncbi:phage terminase small subunit [Bacillus cereus group sp. BfR-BA-01700]|uniref:phage terminase small subunit n=1 Tax=Bacillus cereus group sp. BfR-BA-01700 TaxID=3094884 RepID=UPI003D181B35
MEKSRSPNREKAFEIYKESNGKKLLVEIAEELGISPGTIRGWKSKDSWDDKLDGTFQKEKRNVPQKTERSNKKTGAQKGNKNAVGNPGNTNPKWGNKNAVGHGAPKGNDNAATHGFFRKHFPDDVADLAAEIMEKDPIDMLLENITIQYTAIIRAQRIMFVESKEEMIKELKKTRSEVFQDDKNAITTIPTEEEYEFQFAWDRHATFMNAQSRAMTTLVNLIEKCDKLSKTEEQQLRIEKLKKEIAAIKIDSDTSQNTDDWKESLIKIAERRRKMKEAEKHE